MVKNISGRLLVGLRWWNEINLDGSSSWIFESKPDNTLVNKQDSRVILLIAFNYRYSGILYTLILSFGSYLL